MHDHLFKCVVQPTLKVNRNLNIVDRVRLEAEHDRRADLLNTSYRSLRSVQGNQRFEDHSFLDVSGSLRNGGLVPKDGDRGVVGVTTGRNILLLLRYLLMHAIRLLRTLLWLV